MIGARIRPLAAAACVGLLIAAPATAIANAHADLRAPQPAASDPQPMTILQQKFELLAQDTFDATFGLPAGLDATTLGTDTALDAPAVDIKVVAFGAITDRKDIERLRDGTSSSALAQVEDTFDISLAAADADPHVTRPAADQLSISVAVEAANTEVGLQLPREGVYPIEIDLRIDGETVAEVLTFVHRRSASESTIGNLPVALLEAQTAPVSVSTDGSVEISKAELADLTELTASLEAMDAVATASDPAAPTLPRAVLVQPSTLQALQTGDPALAARLTAVLSRSELIAAPVLPLDPSAVVAAGRDQLYTDWLRNGEDVVGGIVPGVRADRSLYLATDPISDAAVTKLRDLDDVTIVMAPQLYDRTEGNIADYGDPTWLQTIELVSGAEVPVLRIDPYIGARLDATPANPLSAAIDLMAEVMAVRASLDENGRPVSRTGLLLSRSNGGAIDPALSTELAKLLTQVDGIRVVGPSDLVVTMDSQIVDGSVRPLVMPASTGADLTERFKTVDEVTFEAAAIGSMLPSGDGHHTQWQALIDTLPSTALTDADVEEMATTMRSSFDEFRNGVQGPAPFSFTLTGRTGTIRFQLHNTTDTPLTVMVRLDGAKLTFPDNDQQYTVPPQGIALVKADAESKSNGTSQVIVRILTPTGAQIVPDIALTAQVRALTGLGPLITGAGLLVLLTWWARHWRLSRRRDGASATSTRHPAVRGRRERGDGDGGPDESDGGDGTRPAPDGSAAPSGTEAEHDEHDEHDESASEATAPFERDDPDTLAPDAAASSLPPS